jgi:predicted Zn-dependent peptidase
MAATTMPRPDVRPAGLWAYPHPEQLTLTNGLRMLAHHLPGQHVACIVVDLDVDPRLEPHGLEGIATVMAEVLMKGTRHCGKQEFRDQAAALGMDWSVLATSTGPRLTCRVPARQLLAALDLLAEAITGPTFAPQEVRAQTQRGIADLQSIAALPQVRADRQLVPAILGPHGRAALPFDGTPQTLLGLLTEPEMVGDFYNLHATPARARLVIAADLTSVAVEKLLASELSAWRSQATVGTTVDAYVPRAEPVSLLLHQPGAVQTQLLLAGVTVARPHPAWPALLVASQILGAPLTGRLDAELREANGYTYTIQARALAPTPGCGLLSVWGATGTEHTLAALGGVHRILTQAHDDGFTAAEVDAARNYLLGTTPMGLHTAETIAAHTAELAAHSLPLDFPTETLNALTDITVDDVNDAYRAHLRPEELTLIAVGDAATLADPLRAVLATDLQVIPAAS